MRWLLTMLILLPGFSFLKGQVSFEDENTVVDTLSASQAIEYMDSTALFCDKVQWAQLVKDREGKPTIIKIGKTNPGLTIQIWEEDAMKLFGKPAVEVFTVGTSVCARGFVSNFKGIPRIEVGFEDQIWFSK